MRKLTYVSLVAISLCGATPILATSAAAQEQPPVIQTQANPPGEGIPTETPPNPTTAGTPVQPAMPADTSYNAGPYKGALTPAPAEAMGKAYPLCTRTLLDSCINPGEAGVLPAAMKSRRRAKSRN